MQSQSESEGIMFKDLSASEAIEIKNQFLTKKKIIQN